MLLSGSASERRFDFRWNSTHRLYAEPIALPDRPMSGRSVILAVEEYQHRLSAVGLFKNPFWEALVDRPKEVPERVYFGMCVENYHLLYRESYFDSPALSFSFNQTLRQKFNTFYCEELGHDRLLLKSLEAIGITEEMLFLSAPLRATAALCNALSFWARHDPLFFFTTLGPLEGQVGEEDSYVRAMREKRLPDAFITPIETHANINRHSGHGLLTRELFDSLGHVSTEDANRVLRQTPLFIALYDQFYAEIWEHYSVSHGLLRPISHV
jgi:hypothetical protein